MDFLFFESKGSLKVILLLENTFYSLIATFRNNLCTKLSSLCIWHHMKTLLLLWPVMFKLIHNLIYTIEAHRLKVSSLIRGWKLRQSALEQNNKTLHRSLFTHFNNKPIFLFQVSHRNFKTKIRNHRNMCEMCGEKATRRSRVTTLERE